MQSQAKQQLYDVTNKALSVRVCVSNWMDHSVKLFWSLVNIALELPVICLPACGLHPNVSLSESAKEVAAEFKRLQTKVVQRGPCQEINRRSSTLMKRTLKVCGSEHGLLSSRKKNSLSNWTYSLLFVPILINSQSPTISTTITGMIT